MVNGKKIRTLREDANMTLADLSSLIGCSIPQLGFIEQELKRPNIEVLKRIADKFGVTVDDLLRNDTEAS